ncbi:MAG: tetratricopeptide repeat protein [Hyphomicrobium sp.]|uniref:tetratricopeptide repeat protein n=1 Tax=Hyphomicrobium sp. TaxID=82 RepID=UPI0025B91EC5|nr:tetratricopeptide repeat protein [Hyphomicrobium sp.]MBZ0210013.1 tetratricopeptide repeat protein [Hyphomicrobium sp.]
MANDLAPGEAKMLRACFVLIGGVLTGGFLLVALLATSASAGMSQDLASCTAARDRSAAAACTRVMNSGRLPREQMYIGHFNRGTAYQRAGDFAKAISDFTKVLELKPDFLRAYEARGMVHDDRGEKDMALADLDEAVKRDGKQWQFLYSRAVVLRANGDREAALRDLDAAIDLNRDAAFIPLMRALILADQGSYESARAEINRVLAEGRDDAAAHYARAAVAFAEGRIDAAEEDADRALKLHADFAAAHMLKGRILEERGDKTAARKRFDRALAAATDSFDGRTTRRVANERLAVLGKLGNDGKPGKEKRDNLAAVRAEPKAEQRRPLDCKVFLPATGSVVSAKCSE